ncbi:MAG: DUF2268 domain-containing putative Zn-dependent protease [Gemmatimonadales bacterium]
MAGRRDWLWTLALAVAACSTGPDTANDPEQARVVAGDVARFWAAVDAGATPTDFQRLYLDQASPALERFAGQRGVTAISLSNMLQAFPRYLSAARPALSALETEVEGVRRHYRAMAALYPEAVFPTVTLVVGRFSTAGTIGPDGIVIGAEFFGAGPGVPTDELAEFQAANAREPGEMLVVVAHEHVHVLQAERGGLLGNARTLLEQALLEGSADFVAELVTGENLNAGLFEYGLTHEAALWAEFQSAMSGTDVSGWLYNQGAVRPDDRPGDLGYFVGYRIVEAYYRRAADRRRALREIIEVDDATALLTASGYDGSVPPA